MEWDGLDGMGGDHLIRSSDDDDDDDDDNDDDDDAIDLNEENENGKRE